jgi:type VI secretion system protein ImpK
MSSASDPFDNDDAPRIVLPTPGKRRVMSKNLDEPQPEPVARPTLSVADMLAGFRLDGGDVSVMVAEAAPLLNLAHAVRSGQVEPRLDDLRRETVRAVRAYEAALGSAGILPDQARAAHYVVCATLDDVIRNTSWGADWSVEGLVSTFHHDVTGGDKVFELLAHFQAMPGANRDLLLLIYLCLSLGFEGRTRVRPRGAMELSQIRESLFRTLRSQFGIVERDLSPHWKGEDARHARLRARPLFWLLSGSALLLLTALFTVLSMFLNRGAEATLATLAVLPPGTAPSLAIPEPPPAPKIEEKPEVVVEPPTVKVEPAVPEPKAIETFMAFLQPEVEAGLVNLYREGDAVRVRIANAGAFNVGKAEINPDFLYIFERIGEALTAENFDVTIIGHTDNTPIGKAFVSNERLSNARASAVSDIIVSYIEAERVKILGLGDAEPIADNLTEDGKRANRRTEIVVSEVGDRVPDSLLYNNRGGEAVTEPTPEPTTEDQP